jgi:hypothetical protein
MSQVCSAVSSKKEAERFIVRHFMEAHPIEGISEMMDCEEPDFIFLKDGRQMGLEVTEIHAVAPAGQVPLQASQSVKQRCVQRARAVYDQGSAVPLDVMVHFHVEHLTKVREVELAQRIADLVQRNIPARNEVVNVENDWLSDVEILPREVALIRVFNSATVTRSHFSSPGATWVGHLALSDVQRAVDAKAAKYWRYRQRAEKVWLLLSCNGILMSTWFEEPEAASAYTITTPFDRVFLISHFGNLAFEIGDLVRDPT